MNAITKRLKEVLDGYANHTELSAGIEEAIDIIEDMKCIVLEEITEEEAKKEDSVYCVEYGIIFWDKSEKLSDTWRMVDYYEDPVEAPSKFYRLSAKEEK